MVKKSKIIFSVTALKILTRTRIFFYNLNTRTFSILGDSAGSSNSVFNEDIEEIAASTNIVLTSYH